MKFTNRHNLPKYIIKQLSLPHRPVEGRYSVTQLIDAPLPRTLLMERWDNIEVDYSDFLVPYLGTMFHAGQAKHVEDDEQAEHKIEIDEDGLIVVGKSDVVRYNPIQAGILKYNIIHDTKLTKVGFLKFNREKLAEQLNCYCWQQRKNGAYIEKLIGDLFYRDWDYKKIWCWHEKDYPQILYEQVVYEPWPFEQQDEFVLSCLHDHKVNSHRECTAEEKWQTETTYVLMKKGQKKAEMASEPSSYGKTKMMTEQRVVELAQQKRIKVDGVNYWVQRRLGLNIRCEHYCGCRSVCPYSVSRIMT